MSVRFLWGWLGVSVSMIGAGILPAFQHEAFVAITSDFRWTIGGSQMCYLLAGICFGLAYPRGQA